MAARVAITGISTRWGAEVRFLRFGRGVDDRRLREEVGFDPGRDAIGAIEEFVRRTDARRIGPRLHAGSLAGGVRWIGP
jgi:hypothetical protein